MSRFARTLAVAASIGMIAAAWPSAQAPGPPSTLQVTGVRWTIAQRPLSAAQVGRVFDAVVVAEIDAGWRVYGIAQPGVGPKALAIDMSKGPVFSLTRPATEPAAKVELDPNFNVETRFHQDVAVFNVQVQVASGTPVGRYPLRVNVVYQACKDRPCPPPATIALAVDVAVAAPRAIDVSRDAAVAARRIQDPEAKLAALAKARAEFSGVPVHPDFRPMIDEATLVTLYTNFPDRVDAIEQAFDRAVAGMPSDPGERLRRLDSGFYNIDALSGLLERKLLLNRIEQILRTSIEAFEAATGPDDRHPDTTEPLSFGLARLGYVAFAKGDMQSGRAWFQKAFRRAPDNGDVAARLATYYLARSDRPAAEELAKGLSASLPGTDVAAGAALVLADTEIKQGQFVEAERWLASALGPDAVKTEAAMGNDAARAMLALARLEEKRGAPAAAVLDRYMRVAGTQGIRSGITDGDVAAMRALYRKVHGSEAGLDERLDAIARATRPVKPERYSPTPARTTRTVLVELFTGSGCAPCVGDDLAIDGVRDRYRSNDVAILAYHVNVPQPDPMVVSGGLGRNSYYQVTGVPTTAVDGTVKGAWGARREYAEFVHADYVGAIDKALETAPEARLTVRAASQGDAVRVTATASALPADARDLRLHVVLAERELSYASENGMRLHSMVVRAVAGDNGSGVPLAADGTIDYAFDLAAVREDVTRTLAAEIETRRSRPTPAAGASKVFYSEHHAMTAIDPSRLVIVAFVQDGEKHVLQAAQADVTRPITARAKR